MPHSGAMIYLGDSWPAEYRGSLFMNNIHGARLNRDVLEPNGSGFTGSHAPDFLLANDAWSQIVHLEYGPDGSVTMIDWYDKNQCHHNEVNLHDRTNGRIFKVSYGDPKPFQQDLSKLDSAALVQMQTHPNEWYARHARRILQERGPSEQVDEMLRASSRANPGHPEVQLRILWTRHAVGGLKERGPIDVKPFRDTPDDPDPMIRAWTIQLTSDPGDLPSHILDKFAEQARRDPSPVVRLYLASALQRLPLQQRWEIVAGLVGHSEDAADPNLPLMYWYAAEPLVTVDARRAARLAAASRIPRIQGFMARRIGSLGTPESLAILVEELGRAASSANRQTLLTGIEEGLRGRRQVAMPADWPTVFTKLATDPDARVRSRAVALALTFGIRRLGQPCAVSWPTPGPGSI